VTDQILSWLSLYGVAALFGILVIASAGVPFPVTLLLVAAGSLTNQGDMTLWQVLLAGSCGAIAGDQLGYGLARWRGRTLIRWLTDRIGGAGKIEKAESFTQKWGGAGIFFSRWLVTPLGPWINVTSGIAEYSWPRFLLWDVLGESLWVVLYVLLGFFFSDRVQDVAELLGDLKWVMLGAVVAIVAGWKSIQYFRAPDQRTAIASPKAPARG
jgi:membrane-associated protein